MIAVPATSAKAGSILKTFVFLFVFAETFKVWFITFTNGVEFVLKQLVRRRGSTPRKHEPFDMRSKAAVYNIANPAVQPVAYAQIQPIFALHALHAKLCNADKKVPLVTAAGTNVDKTANLSSDTFDGLDDIVTLPGSEICEIPRHATYVFDQRYMTQKEFKPWKIRHESRYY